MKARHMPKKLVIALASLLVLAGAGYGIYCLVACEEAPSGQLTLYGNVDIRQVRLAFNASGRVTSLPLQEGDRAQAGQLVAQLEDLRYQANEARARAQVAAQEQKVARLERGSRPEEIARARANLEEAQARLQDASKLYQRHKALAKTKSLPPQQLDNTTATYEAARAQVDAARQSLELAVKGPRVEDIAAAQAELRAAQAELELATKNLADTKLYAPSAGVVQARVLEPGDMASPERPVYTLALTSPVWVRAFVEEPDLGKIAPGMTAYVFTDSYPDKKYQGWVGYISPTAEFTPKRVQTTELRTKLVYRVKIVVCNPEGELRLGMPVTVTIGLDQAKNPEGRGQSQPCPEKAS
ncbi:hemolysin D [Desulfocarbo indianensis]|nr:hemolysin D [Desulfocarbo indianensis]